MAVSRAFSDPYGNTYADSYWMLVQCNICPIDQNAMVLFYGYRSEPDRRAKKSPIGSKQYSVSGPDFVRLMTEHLTKGTNIMALAYALAKETKDEVDPEDPENKISFFENATDLL